MTRHGRRCMLAGCLAAVLAAAGCSATPVDGAAVLEGTLVLRGNEPHVSFVLVRPAGEQWELQDVPAATGRRLQNRTVRVTGVVTRAPGGGWQLPALRVSQLQPAR